MLGWGLNCKAGFEALYPERVQSLGHDGLRVPVQDPEDRGYGSGFSVWRSPKVLTPKPPSL